MNLNNDSPELEEEELFEHHRHVADKGQSLLRVDKFLMHLIANATRNKIQKAAEDGNIWVNDIPVKSNYRVKPFDVVRVMLSHPPFENLILPENIPLDIVYEDEALLIINKPPGLVVHPGHGNYTGTLVNALAFHFENLPKNSSDRPGLVHRIDKNTSGLLVVAKTEQAMTHLAKQFEDKTTEREYIALVWGNVKEEEGTIEGNIARHVKDRMQMAVFPEGDIGNTTARFHLRLSSPSGKAITVAYETTDNTATAGVDYQPTLGTAILSPGTIDFPIDVTVLGDQLDEDDESFYLNLSNPVNVLIPNPRAAGTIPSTKGSL